MKFLSSLLLMNACFLFPLFPNNKADYDLIFNTISLIAKPWKEKAKRDLILFDLSNQATFHDRVLQKEEAEVLFKQLLKTLNYFEKSNEKKEEIRDIIYTIVIDLERITP